MERDKIKVLAISGSTKKNSSNASILKFISSLYQDQLDVEIFEGIENLPHFNPDLDTEKVPEAVTDFRNKIVQAEGVIICTPEYVFSLPGSLKNAIEWNVSTTNFSNKAVAIIVAAASGEKAFESLELVMTTIESRIAEQSKLLIKGVKAKVNPNGQINDPDTTEKIKSVVKSFIQSIKEKNPRPSKYIVQ